MIKKFVVAELDGELLNLAVAVCEGYRMVEGALAIGQAIVANEIVTFRRDGVIVRVGPKNGTARWNPREDWGQGGPIIERECIELDPAWKTVCPGNYAGGAIRWDAMHPKNLGGLIRPRGSAPKPLPAAMRCYVASRHGETIMMSVDDAKN